MRKNYSTGAKWEDVVGYSRAVRIGNMIEVSGSTSLKDGMVVFPNDAYRQTIRILEIIQDAIESLGGKMEDVIRTRIYVTDISQWKEIGKAHGEFFSKIKPATVMIEIKALIDPEMVVEIEATAIVEE